MILGSFPIFQTYKYCQTMFSEILIAKSIEKEAEIIIKTNKGSEVVYLKNQFKVLTQMQQYEGFPKLYHTQFEQKSELTSILIQKLGISLKSIIENSKTHNIKIPIFGVVNLAFQMLDRVQKLHMNGYIHNDLKPEHFLFETNDPSSIIYLIDFGLAAPIQIDQLKNHVNFQQNAKFSGNIAYSSVNKMKCRKQNIRDDLESLVYIIGQLLEGQLPWNPKRVNLSERSKWKSSFSAVLSKKLQKNIWKKYGGWISQTLKKVWQKQDPYRQLRKNISLLLQFEC